MSESLPVELARQSLQYFLTTGDYMPRPDKLQEELKGQAGVFVSLKKHGQLRGCIGTFSPSRNTIAEEIIYNAVSAGTEDPRFSPVTSNEIKNLNISVDILSAPEKISSLKELDPRRYGVIVRHGRRTGLLLPDLEGVDTVEAQVAIAKEKAGIHPGETVELYRFYVTRYQ